MITLHTAPKPHDPGHGSLHFSLKHALLLTHSALITHSGRQFGGFPVYSDKQEHDGDPPISLHCEKGPHGEGTHGSLYTGVAAGTEGTVNKNQ